MVWGCLSVKLNLTMDFAFLKPYFQGMTTRMGAPFWLGRRLSVTAEGEESEGIHGFVEAEAFGVGPVVAAGEVGHLLAVEEGDELDVFGAGERLAEVDELGERVAIPGDDHGPGFDAAMAVDAAFDGAVLHDAVDVDSLGLFDHAGDLDGPGAGLEGMGVFGRFGFVGAELVEIVVVGGFVEGGLVFGRWCICWGWLELVAACAVISGWKKPGWGGGDGSCAEGGCSGEEAAAGPVELSKACCGVMSDEGMSASNGWTCGGACGVPFASRIATIYETS